MRIPRPKLVIPIAVAAAVVLAALIVWRVTDAGPTNLRYDQFLSLTDKGSITRAEVNSASGEISGTDVRGRDIIATVPPQEADRVARALASRGAKVKVTTSESTWLDDVVANLIPTLLIVGVFLWFVISTQGANGQGGKFSRVKARAKTPDDHVVRFADVAGADEAVAELAEVVDFLKDPEKFSAVGAKIPRGVLLYGPPGTGKTLLARAVAGEAGVPFLSLSGSDFVEMFVGVGAGRVRDLFRQASAQAPAIVFVDEIDAVGRQRGAGVGGGHDEREQTLNQLLVEMDGFDQNSGVILMAATNRPDILDPALLRPGRFDRQIGVDAPDLNGRAAILAVHARHKRLADDVDLMVIARRTPGCSGADLANIVNEAAILTARRGESVIALGDFSEAIDRVMAGPQRQSRVMSDDERQTVAAHEAGHAIVGWSVPGNDPVHRVSIVARGVALGWTLSLPTEDRYLQTDRELAAKMAMMLGGRTAEELLFGRITTGAADDIDRVTTIARRMVTEFGMSADLGPRKFGQQHAEPFLGREFSHQPDYSEEVASAVDDEIRRLIETAHDAAREVLTARRADLEALAAMLIDIETVEEDQLSALLGPRATDHNGGQGL